MTIRDNIREKRTAVVAEQPNGGPVSAKLKEKAIAAILGGAAEWVNYMRLFAKTPGELARLIPSDGTQDDAEKREARAYLVANAVCAPGTTGDLERTVNDRFDHPPVV